MHKPPDHFLLFRSSPYPYLVMDTALTVIDANDAYLRGVGRVKEDIVGRYVFDAFPENPDDPGSTNIQEVKHSLEMAIATKTPNNTPFLRYSVPLTKNGQVVFEERFWSTVHTPALRDDGTVAFVYQNAIDVTDLYQFDRHSQSAALQLDGSASSRAENFNRAQMHEAMVRILKDERGHLRNLFNQAPGFVAVLTGPEHVFEMANESYYQLVGHRDIIGKRVWEALPEVQGQGFEARLAEVYQTGVAWKTYGMPIAVQRQAGGPIEQRYVDLSYQAYRNGDGVITGIFAQGYDVTEAHDARRAEQESTERLRDGLVAARMVVWDWDLRTNLLNMSDNAEQVLGLASDDYASVEQRIVRDDMALLNAAREKAMAERSAYHMAVRFVRPDTGETVWIEVRGCIVCDAAGEPASVRGIVIDISERMKAEEELREADRRKDEFLAMLAHELRNPLAPISTAAEVLRFAADQPQRVRSTSEIISRQVRHMTNLVDDLLDVSRVTRGLIELDKERLDVHALVTAAVEQARPLMEARGHALSTRFSATPAIVRGDRTRLVQVLSNLLNNSAKYTPQAGVIELSVAVDDASVRITVQDDGIGIEASLLPHLFELFTQGHRTSDRAQGGLGLGLALVKSMLLMHRGEIEARSDGPGTGSTFIITLPRYDDAALPAPGPAASLQALRIMLVDDQREATQALATQLEACGHEVLVAVDGREALKVAAINPPHAFVIDVGRAGMNGYELARHLRQQPATARATLVALTANSQAHDRVLLRAAGFAHHFVKPVAIAELMQALAAPAE